MNFSSMLQLFIFIIFSIGQIKSETQYLESDETCEVKPNNADKVEIVVYINGETYYDQKFYERYCSWKDGGFPYDTYAPVTIKAGARIACDEDNKCICPSDGEPEGDCKLTFEHVCAEQILGQAEFINFLCCTKRFEDQQSQKVYGYKKCVKQRPGLTEKIADCVKKTGPGSPQEIALKTAQEVIDKKVNVEINTEPYFFFNEIFEECINNTAAELFIQKICQMLKKDIATNIKQCPYAMGWSETES